MNKQILSIQGLYQSMHPNPNRKIEPVAQKKIEKLDPKTSKTAQKDGASIKLGPQPKVENQKQGGKGTKGEKVAKKEEVKIEFQQTKKVPEPDQVGQTAIRHYPYFHDKKKSKVYFYPMTSIDGDCRYNQLLKQPEMTEEFIADLTCCFPKEPVYVVPAEVALKKLDQFKKEGKYQKILEFKNFNKDW